MIASTLDKVDFVVANTDAQSLRISKAPIKIQLGRELTKGLGAGSCPDVGMNAAIEDRDNILESMKGLTWFSSPLAWVAVLVPAPRRYCGDRPRIRRSHRWCRDKPFTYEGKARTEAGRTRHQRTEEAC